MCHPLGRPAEPDSGCFIQFERQTQCVFLAKPDHGRRRKTDAIDVRRTPPWYYAGTAEMITCA
jgi:hypothetical protein